MDTYEKKYKEALERAKDNYNAADSANINVNSFKNTLIALFPELAESEGKPNGGIVREDFTQGNGWYKVNLDYLSKAQVEEIEQLVEKWNPKEVSEDEKIKKAILIYLDWLDGKKDYLPKGDYTIKDMILWLEKQKEPLDKGEISDGYHTFNELYYYRMLYNAAFFNLLPKEWVHKSRKHHTGEECFGGGWFIVMAELPTGQISNHYEMKDWDLFDIPEKDVADEWDGHTPQEAAERLHNYLLEKQGEKPIMNVPSREVILAIWDLGNEWKELTNGSISTEYGNQLNYIQKHWHESEYYLRAMQDEQKPEENKGNIGGISPNWSEEDEKNLRRAIRATKVVYPVAADWLQSLQDRVQPQPKQEWSEEDEQHIDSLLKRLDALCRNKFERTRFAISEDRDWLKSLRPQNRWKPSELQLGCLSDAIEHYNSLGYPAPKLKELLDDLKKLKEGNV